MTTTIMNKVWKLKGHTQRILNINADAVIPLHTVYVVTVDDEPVMAVRAEHFELEPGIKSRIEFQLAQHVVELHNKSLAPISKDLTNVQVSVTTSPAPKKKGGWPKGKPRKPKTVTNGKEVQAATQSGRGAEASATQSNQGSQVKEGVQAQPFPPSGEGWFRP